jgi:uncharacterized protein YpuA (DUF1002 family)
MTGRIKVPYVGCWVSYCCYLDLYKVEDEEELNSVIENLEESLGVSLYDSEVNALKDIRNIFVNSPDDTAAIDERINKIESN